jgi:acetyltransferase-like isoleucine patch superfamily enzyme
MSDEPARHPDPNRFQVVVEVLTLAVEVVVYIIALSPTLAVLAFGLDAPFPLLLTLAVGSWVVDAVLFVLALILLKTLMARRVSFGRFRMTDHRVFPWMLADRINKMMIRSPFRGMINDYGFLRLLYYRGMGAKIGHRFLVANSARILDPWALRVGDDVLIGEDVLLSGHTVERSILTVREVELGNSVLIGGRSTIFPGVKVGDAALVAANAVVPPGTIVAPGKIWHGSQREAPSPSERKG